MYLLGSFVEAEWGRKGLVNEIIASGAVHCMEAQIYD